MTTSVRLSSADEQALARLSKTTGKSRSALIREAIRQLGQRAEKERMEQTAYERLSSLIGVVDRGPSDRAARSEELLRTAFGRKEHRR